MGEVIYLKPAKFRMFMWLEIEITDAINEYYFNYWSIFEIRS